MPLRDFQAQLESFSSMLDIDTATFAGRKLEKRSVKNGTKNEVLSDDLASKVRLDLFHAGYSGNGSPTGC